jgi:hypothetical protein
MGCGLKKSLAEHFRVLGFQQSPLVTVTFGAFVITFTKDIGDGGLILCEFLKGCYMHSYSFFKKIMVGVVWLEIS